MRIGIVLPIGERGDPPRPTPYSQMRELAVLTEQSGLDSIWVADHLFYEPPTGPRRGMWESWTTLSALAEATNRVELGPLVLCTPFRNPGLLAWMANTLEEVSNGRLVLGLGAGWHEPEFNAFDFEFERRVTLFDDSLEIIIPLLREGTVDYKGELASGHAQLAPRGPRSNGPPIMISATRPRMMALAAKWADRYNTVWYGRPNDDFDNDRENLVAACHQLGRDPAEIEISAGLHVVGELMTDNVARPDAQLAGPPEGLADAFREWQELGVAEIMCRIDPATPQMVERIARAADILGRG